jgi:hypothetical protein
MAEIRSDGESVKVNPPHTIDLPARAAAAIKWFRPLCVNRYVRVLSRGGGNPPCFANAAEAAQLKTVIAMIYVGASGTSCIKRILTTIFVEKGEQSPKACLAEDESE